MAELIQALLIPSLVAASPLFIATLGAILTYRAGLLDIGLEGKIAVGTLTAIAWVTWAPNAPTQPTAWIDATLMAIAGALAISLVHAAVVLIGKADAFISAIGINLIGLALVPLGLQAAFGSPGSSPGSARITAPAIHPALGPLTMIDLAGILGALTLAYWLARTKTGAHLHAVGVAPEAARQAGIHPARWHFIALAGSGVGAGLCAAQLTVGSIGLVSPMMVGGRGFLALAAAVVGRGRVFPAMLACLVVGIGEALADYLVTQTSAPQLLLALPWALAFVGITLTAVMSKLQRV